MAKSALLYSSRRNVFEMFDYILFLCMAILVSVGIAFIYSSGVNSDGFLVTNEYIKQIIWASLGLVLMVFFAIYDYRNIERFIQYIFIAFLIILIYTAIFGKNVKGARSWIGIGDFGVQPSEFMKTVFILMLAKYLSESVNEKPLARFIKAGIILSLPVGLILIQPDFGTASIYVPIFIIMCFMAEIPFIYIFFIMAFASLTVFLTVLPVWNNVFKHGTVAVVDVLVNFKLRMIVVLVSTAITLIAVVVRKYFKGPKYYFWITYTFSIIALAFIFSLPAGKFLKPYQIQRLIIFIDPTVDPRDTGWNIIQSKTAIGAGGMWGRKFLQGTQSHYRYLPEQSTDFIFSILSEEMGFMGGILVFSLYGIFLLRILAIIRKTLNRFGAYIASGIFAMMFFHFFINVGMVMGLMPITGIPLLFLSYGGSSLWTAMVCTGILMSIGNKQYDITSAELG